MATPISNTVALTGSPFIDGLTQGSAWGFSGPHVITYSFSLYDFGAQQPSIQWPEYWKDALRGALGAWSDVANISFQEVSSGTLSHQSSADIALSLTGNALSQTGAIAEGLFPDPVFANLVLSGEGLSRSDWPQPEGDVFFDNDYPSLSAPSDLLPGAYGYEVVLHELGHALGLKHPFDDGGNGRPTFAELAIGDFDSVRYTVMTYDTPVGRHPATPMLLDVQAIQSIYGANMAYHTGADTYVPGTGTDYRVIWDAGGIDTLDASSLSGSIAPNGVTLDISGGGFSGPAGVENTAIAYGAIIENAIGTTANDKIDGNNSANILSGGAGSDTIAGWGGNDTLDGGFGADILSGGGGDDIFMVDSAGDVVIEKAGEGTDDVYSSVNCTLSPNLDHLWLTGSANLTGTGNGLANELHGNAGNNLFVGGGGNDLFDGLGGLDTVSLSRTRASYAIQHVNGVVQITSVDGTETITSSTEQLQFSDATQILDGVRHAGGKDFFGDGHGDLLLRSATGGVQMWSLDATTVTAQYSLPNPGPAWTLAGAADFNGDGKTDLLWRHDSGLIGLWSMDGATLAGAAALPHTVPNDWKIASAGDFNGDGKADVLWRNDSGTVAIWQMDGSTITNSTALPYSVPTSWNIEGTGDFNGDGRTDIVWRNDSGTLGVWLMDGTQASTTVALPWSIPETWKLVGDGDFSGDGRSDLLWRHDSGLVGLWTMDGASVTSTVAFSSIPPAWRLAGTTEANGDGHADIVWQHDTGMTGVWLMDDTHITSASLLSQSTDPGWILS